MTVRHRQQRRRIEGVLNQAVPAVHNEVSDPAPSPWADYLAAVDRPP